MPSPVTLLLSACVAPNDAASRHDRQSPEPTLVAAGEITWTAVFDAEATAAGAVDCAYTRSYAAVEDLSTPWSCPACEVVLRADVTMSEAGRACFRSVAGTEPAEVERLGWDDHRVFRASQEFAPLVELGLRTDAVGGADPELAAVTSPIPLATGSVQLWLSGGFTTSTVVGDPWGGMVPPPTYACGWPILDPPAWAGAWAVTVGAQLPDGWFRDACDEPVRLHDLAGRYTVLDLGSTDCGPCQQMAAEEPAFVREMAALGFDVGGVTLLSRSLGEPLVPADAALLEAWSTTFRSHGVVLGDRGWGYAMSETVWPGRFAYPSWVVLSPAFEVLATGQGYGGWSEIRSVIVDHRRQ